MKRLEKKQYVGPAIKIKTAVFDSQILASSPAANPGDGGTSVVPPSNDDDDSELELGAKPNNLNMWE